LADTGSSSVRSPPATAKLFESYRSTLRARNLVDFDDLIRH